MEPFIGQIQAFGFNFAPRGWATCDGQLLPVSQYTALFSLLGTTYGGDGRTTFALPDLRGRVPMHQGTGPGLSQRTIGQKFGTENETLDIPKMPSHSHPITLSSLTATLNAKADDGENRGPGGGSLANANFDFYSPDAPDTPMHAGSVTVSGTGTCQNTGGSQPHNNIQPSLVINYCIALEGIFPSRN